jgi:hypothetical protein
VFRRIGFSIAFCLLVAGSSAAQERIRIPLDDYLESRGIKLPKYRPPIGFKLSDDITRDARLLVEPDGDRYRLTLPGYTVAARKFKFVSAGKEVGTGKVYWDRADLHQRWEDVRVYSRCTGGGRYLGTFCRVEVDGGLGWFSYKSSVTVTVNPEELSRLISSDLKLIVGEFRIEVPESAREKIREWMATQ